MYFLVFLGLVVLAITYWDYRKEETDTVLLLDWWVWFDVSKARFPVLYWLIITLQSAGGLALVLYGLINS
ncbi:MULTISPECIES: hypothetical protein [Pseudoalteromonas]|uniref:hypothetical protein n=1 Tax=Pseudoalteromonas TaxID=53246 RepID=UPI001023C065|nr:MULTISPECIES: hypothetical protein [Pseudoalteromonas]RZF83010.1 hypothetical protein EXT46_06030 [Pseudoalteromonas sp. CO325X]